MDSAARCLSAVLFLLVPVAADAGGVSNDLLLSSAWCSFKFNKISGTSSGQRVSFSPNGTYRVSSGTETGSSGRSGSVASQSSSAGGGRWKVERGELFMSEGGQFDHVETVVRRNNNGYPIIVADGTEFSQCR